jgi:hypothetical protein
MLCSLPELTGGLRFYQSVTATRLRISWYRQP